MLRPFEIKGLFEAYKVRKFNDDEDKEELFY